MTSIKNILVRHLGNLGDMVFLVPPALETLKRKFPGCHITFVTAWGFKSTSRKIEFSRWGLPCVVRRAKWGKRNQGGFSLHLMITNPHIDQLVHYHSEKLNLEGGTCTEDGKSFPTWNKDYYHEQKSSGAYDAVYELDFGIGHEDNPIKKMYELMGMPEEDFSNYKIHLSENDMQIAQAVTNHWPHPRIVLLEGLEGETTRGWDPDKIPALEKAIKKKYGVKPIWFGGKHVPTHEGQPLTLRQNIATLTQCDVGIGVMSGPLHFAAAVGLPTLTLFCDQPLHRAAPAYFLNQYITNPNKRHRTLLGPDCKPYRFLKSPEPPPCLTPDETSSQKYKGWQNPGRQNTKSCLGPITVDEVITALSSML